MKQHQSAIARAAHCIDRVVFHIEEKAIAASVLLLAGILITNVILRTLNSSLASTEELSQFLMYFITFLGTSYAARKGMHIRMSMLSDAAKPAGQKILCIVVSLVTAIVLFYVAWLCYRYVMKIASFHRVSPILGWPVENIWIIMPIGMLLTAIQYTLAFVKNLTAEGAWIAYSVPVNCEPEAFTEFDEQLIKHEDNSARTANGEKEEQPC